MDGLIFVLVLLAVLATMNIAFGYRQKRAAGGTWLRLLGVSVAVACLQSIPVWVCVFLAPVAGDQLNSEEITITTIMTSVACSVWCVLFLRPPFSWNGSKDDLPLSSDPQFTARIAELAAAMSMPVPVVRIFSSPSSSLAVQAFAGGLPAPSVVVSDGVLFRLEPLERDAIVAHELAHIANHSLWFYPATGSAAAVAGVIATLPLDPWTATAFAGVVFVGLRRLVSRYFEFDCDRRAAQVVGYRATVKALAKVHAASIISNQGWISFLAYSMSTHPSVEERLSALADAAPDNDQPAVTWSTRLGHRRRWGARAAAILWLLVLGLALSIPSGQNRDVVRGALLVLAIVTPMLLLQAGIRKEVRQRHKRMQPPRSRTGTFVWLTVTALAAAALFWRGTLDREQLIGIAYIGFAIAGVFTFLRSVASQFASPRSANSKLDLAFQQRRWNDVITIWEQHQKTLRNQLPIRNAVALARWHQGMPQQAIEELIALRAEFPHSAQPGVTAALMMLDQGHIEESLELALSLAAEFPKDPDPHIVAARCQRLLGATDRVREHQQAIEALFPGCASSVALQTTLALDENEMDAACERLEQTEALAPGEPFVVMLRSEWEHRAGNQQEAEQAARHFNALLEVSPFVFLGAEQRRLKQLLQRNMGNPGEDASEPFAEKSDRSELAVSDELPPSASAS